MQIRTTLAFVAAALTLGVPVAAANPDGYQPQLRAEAQPDAVDRYLANHGPDGSQPQLRTDAGPDAVDRYLANVRRSTPAPVDAIEAGGIDWQAGAIGALGGGLVILLLVAGTVMVRQRRRLLLH
jgi:hypothetical protein